MSKHQIPSHFAMDTRVLHVRVGSGGSKGFEMGMCIEPLSKVIGVAQAFEQYTWRSQPAGIPLGHGDLDVTIYSLRKWLGLATGGSAIALLPLFVPDSDIVTMTEVGRFVRENRHLILSRRAGSQYLRGLVAQRDRVDRATLPSRTDLVNRHGYNPKAAYHALRMGMQGCELMATGTIALPMSEDDREYLNAARRSDRDKVWVLQEIQRWEDALGLAINASPLPKDPDVRQLEPWLVQVYFDAWRQRGELPVSTLADGSLR